MGKAVKTYRTKTIKSGPMLECEIYPLWLSPSGRKREAKMPGSSEAQKNLNNKNLRKRFVRLLNANFNNSDIWITLGYRGGAEPKSLKEARRDITNYIRRLSRYCEKMGWSKLKYVYVTEYSPDTRVHHHIVCNFPDRDVAEKKWGKGEYPQARRLSLNDYGLEGLARYISKDPKGKKTYGYSHNLYKSWEHATTADSKVTRRKVGQLACEIIPPREFFQKLYPQYRFCDMEVFQNPLTDENYIYVRMRREGDAT